MWTSPASPQLNGHQARHDSPEAVQARAVTGWFVPRVSRPGDWCVSPGLAGRYDELAQGEVAEGYWSARAGERVDVDSGFRDAEQLEAIQEPGGRVPERAGAGVAVQELRRR